MLPGRVSLCFLACLLASASLAFASLAFPGAGHAGEPSAGARKARRCQTCHGLDGMSRQPEAPNLSGQVEGYIVKALHDFQSGARRNDMMDLIVRELQDQDIADLAAYYSGFEVTVQPRQ
jgi:cytochrome c553